MVKLHRSANNRVVIVVRHLRVISEILCVEYEFKIRIVPSRPDFEIFEVI